MWAVLALVITVYSLYIHFKHHSPFKGYSKFLKTVVYFYALVLDYALWPIAQILR
jgi:hypothetical protein